MMALLSFFESLLSLACLSVIYIVILVIFRLYFSPLAKFPGPKLAAASLWYEFYFDVVKRGRYTWRIAELHAQYGPIVRISPYELHINDPDYVDELYVGSSIRRTLKYDWAVRGFGPPTNVFATANHEHHRTRRGAVAPFFSKSLVTQLEPSVGAMVQKLANRIEEFKSTGKVIDMVDMYASLVADVICQYTFARSYGYLDLPNFAPLWHEAIMAASEASHMFTQFPWLDTLTRQIPQSLVRKLAPRLSSLLVIEDMIREKVDQVQADIANNTKSDSQRTIFYDLITNDSLAPAEKTPERLVAEGFAIVGAGSHTVAHTLAVTSYHIIANPAILRKLRDELASVLPTDSTMPKWNTLEQLPYLGAVIQEGLRVSCAVPHRLQRISPDVDLTFQGWIIPKGTPVGMTSILQHFNPDIFPSPNTFSPDRWLQPDSAQLRNLAYCELYLTLATIFAPGRFEFELFETGIEDVVVKHDFFNASQSLESKGIRVKVS
ncbi:MAG: hypothetical protein Q9168_008143 [Polycauliona sp. 1 TL-2023]